MTSVVPSKRPAEEETHSPPLKRKAPEVSDAIITSVLWTNPKDTVPGGHEVFGSLEASTTFETLREYLVAHNRVLEIFHTRLLQNNMRRLFMDQIVVMAMNDFTCRAGKPGLRLLHLLTWTSITGCRTDGALPWPPQLEYRSAWHVGLLRWLWLGQGAARVLYRTCTACTLTA